MTKKLKETEVVLYYFLNQDDLTNILLGFSTVVECAAYEVEGHKGSINGPLEKMSLRDSAMMVVEGLNNAQINTVHSYSVEGKCRLRYGKWGLSDDQAKIKITGHESHTKRGVVREYEGEVRVKTTVNQSFVSMFEHFGITLDVTVRN